MYCNGMHCLQEAITAVMETTFSGFSDKPKWILEHFLVFCTGFLVIMRLNSYKMDLLIAEFSCVLIAFFFAKYFLLKLDLMGVLDCSFAK